MDGNLFVGLAEILSGRPPAFTLRTRCTAQAYSLSSDDIHTIFYEARPGGVASAAGSGVMMRLVAQATAVHLRKKMMYLAAQWERVVHRVIATAADTSIAISAESAASATRVESKMVPDVGGTGRRSSQTLAAVGRLFEDGMWSPRQNDSEAAESFE